CSSGCGAFIESFANSPVEPTKGKQIFSNINGNACLIMIRSPEAPRGVIGIFRVPNMYEDYQF
ncbi:MAG: hypothetical protein PUE85_02755, partial [Firmicutes bacterium]|nr:hypothetical protein [Bacillota bacterium]